MAELLANYEINSTPRWPRLMRFVVGSIIFHAIAVSAAIYVPAVRSALNLVNAFKDAGFISEDYSKIDPRDVQILNFNDPNGRFHYPDGYFAPNALFTTDPALIAAKLHPENYPEAQIVELYKDKPTPKPTPTPRVNASPTPTPTASASPVAATAQNATPSNANAAANPDKEKADALEKQAQQQYGVKAFPKINKKPFVDLLAEGNRMKNAGEIDLSKPIHLEIEADLNADGTLTNYKVVNGPSDKKLLDFALKFVNALSQSKALAALDGAQTLNLNLTADDKTVSAVASTQFETEQSAEEKAKGYNLLLVGGQLLKKEEPAATIFKSTSVAAKGKQVFVNFRMPRTAAGDILKKQLPAS